MKTCHFDLLIAELVHILLLTGSNRYIFDANQIISDVFIRFWVDEKLSKSEIPADVSGCIGSLIGQRSSETCSCAEFRDVMVTCRNIDHRPWRIDQKKGIGAALGIKIAWPIGLFSIINQVWFKK